MLTQQAAIEKVYSFVQTVKKSGIQLKLVVLYGSFSRNEQHEDSDIDVALVADKFTGNGFKDFDIFGKTLIQKQFSIIQPRTYKTCNFTPDKDPFVEEILRTGIEIV